MFVKDFIKKLEEYGFNDKTELKIGAYSEFGDWHEFKIESIDDERDMVEEDYLIVDVEVASKLIEQNQDDKLIEFTDELRNVINKYRVD